MFTMFNMTFRLIFVCLSVFISATAFAQSGGVLVSVAPLRSSQISPYIEYAGDVKYHAISRVAAERAGRIEAVYTEDGRDVTQDQVLVVLNRDILQHSIRAEEARVEQQRMALDKARRDFERAEALFKDDAVSRQRYDDAETEYMVSSRLYDAISATLQVMKEELSRATIRAPFDGTVLVRHVNLYEWVSAGAPIVDIASSQLEAVVNVPQSVVGYVKHDMEVEVIVEGKSYAGIVRAVVPQGSLVSRNFPVRIDLPHAPELYGGMDCKVRIPSAEPVFAMLVPRDAMLRRNNVNVIFTVVDNRAVMVPVEFLGFTGIFAGVSSPELRDGMMVVTRGYERLSNGQNVIISGL